MNRKATFWILLVVWAPLAFGQTVVSTPHNLSTGGTGSIKATTESEVCVFCHTPHNGRPVAPLWNRNDAGTTYTLYNSSTLEASVGQPDGSSILCLSCHDGTVALGEVVSRTTDISFNSGITTMPVGNRNNLKTDISDDHPISFSYTSALATSDGNLKDPATLGGGTTLENGKLQCISCHDPHDNTLGQFLVATKLNSQLCIECHTNSYWSGSTHSSSGATYGGGGAGPWAHIETPYATVSANACENCHAPHSASGNERLLKKAVEEDNCLDCHNGDVASTDVQTEILKTYSHSVTSYSGIHDPKEATLASTLHVECTDCHNPHASNAATASAPNANGFLRGVKGIDTNGNEVNPVNYEYELCYRCHADSPNKPASTRSRLYDQNNVRLEFDPGNNSYHPIEAAGKNTNVPSLTNGYTTSSIIYCTDCHASNDNGAPFGPHGSIYPQILKLRYEHGTQAYNTAKYALCFQCHSESSLRNDQSFKEHDKHFRGEDASCSVCHDPHGISITQASGNRGTHLVNMDLSLCSPASSRLYFQDDGNEKGRCYVSCHGKNHTPKSY